MQTEQIQTSNVRFGGHRKENREINAFLGFAPTEEHSKFLSRPRWPEKVMHVASSRELIQSLSREIFMSITFLFRMFTKLATRLIIPRGRCQQFGPVPVKNPEEY
jgi:hypothetical protein